MKIMMKSDETHSIENEDVSLGDYDEALARKEALSNWFAKTSRSVINDEIENIKNKVGKRF